MKFERPSPGARATSRNSCDATAMTKLAEQIGAEEDYDDDYYGPLQYGTGAEQRKPVMTLAIAKRPPEAVKELEAMQQKERAGAGEPVLSTEDFERLLRADIEGELISN